MKSALKTPVIYLLLAALVIKLAYLLAGFPEAGLESALSIDELYHFNWASKIASGDVLTNAPYFRAPFYPFFLAALLKLTGFSLFSVRQIQLLMGLVTIWLTYKTGRALFSPLVGLAAGILLTLYPIVTFFESQLLLDSLFTLLALGSFYFFIETEEKKANILAAGLLFGIAAITRPTILLFAPIAVYILWRRYPGDFRRFAGHCGLFAAATMICIAPVTIINYSVSGQTTLIAYQGGVNFYIGNNPEANGLYSEFPGFGADWTIDDVDYQTHVEAGKPLRYSEQSDFWFNKGLRYIIDNPSDFAALYLKRLFFFFSGHEVSNNRILETSVFSNDILRLLPVRFVLLLALMVTGLCLPGSHNRRVWKLAGIILVYALAISLFFVASRFRLPVIPLVCILAAVGIERLLVVLTSRQFGRRLFFAVVLGIGSAIFFSADLYPDTKVDSRQALFTAGNRAMRSGRYSTAIAYYDSIIERPGYFRNSYVNRGLAYLKLGDTRNSLASFHGELRVNPRSAEAMNNLAAVFLVNQQIDSARFYASAALAVQPYNKEAAINLLRAAVRDSAGRSEIEAQRRKFRRYVEKYPEYLFEEALYFAAVGRYSEAIDNQLRVKELLDNSESSVSFKTLNFSSARTSRERLRVLADYQLGYLYGLTGQYGQSIRYSRLAIAGDGMLREAYINLISGYRSLGRNREADSVVAKFLTIWPE